MLVTIETQSGTQYQLILNNDDATDIVNQLIKLDIEHNAHLLVDAIHDAIYDNMMNA